jgi:hypothetical protein
MNKITAELVLIALTLVGVLLLLFDVHFRTS